MKIIEKLRSCFGNQISLEKTEDNVFRIYAPFFHEDGDMYSMYLVSNPDDTFSIRDYGNTLMRVSYTFDIDTQNKRQIISNLITSNSAILDNGEIVLHADFERLTQAIFQFSQIVSKVSCIDILRSKVVKSLFYEYLHQFVIDGLSAFDITENVAPINDDQLIVDYKVAAKKPIFIFGVNGDVKASKVLISCLTFQKQKLPFRSLIVHEDFDSLTRFSRKQITNASDKQYASLSDFEAEGVEYLERELSS